jgi:hypothetical protein
MLGVFAWNFSATCEEVENPKSEARNPKQYPMTQIQMTETKGCWVFVLNIGAFVFRICFEFRISTFEFNFSKGFH